MLVRAVEVKKNKDVKSTLGTSRLASELLKQWSYNMHGQYLFYFTVAWGKAVNDVNKVGENAISMVFFYFCHTVKRPCPFMCH